MTASAMTPFALLRDIESRSRSKALGLPQQIEIRRTWSGIGFRLGDDYLLTEMDDVEEILISPVMTRVPSALSWVKGISNIRGMLLPILDLRDFIDKKPVQKSKKMRVLLIHKDEFITGLMVDEVFGMRHFFEEEKAEQALSISETLQKYTSGAYRKGDTHWSIFNMGNLISDPAFLEVAART